MAMAGDVAVGQGLGLDYGLAGTATAYGDSGREPVVAAVARECACG